MSRMLLLDDVFEEWVRIESKDRQNKLGTAAELRAFVASIDKDEMLEYLRDDILDGLTDRYINRETP